VAVTSARRPTIGVGGQPLTAPGLQRKAATHGWGFRYEARHAAVERRLDAVAM
jgi:hypothetical protein